MPITCTPAELARLSVCFGSIAPGDIKGNWIYSLCQWANAAEAVCQSSFVTFPTTAARNDITIAVGFQFQVVQDIRVTKLGRLYVAGNVQDHVANLWLGPSPGTLLVSGTILAASASDANNFKWVDVVPTVLTPGNTYVIGIDEYNTGDTWKDTWSTVGFLDAANFSSVVEKFTVGSSVFPSTGVAADRMYSTPAMCFFLSDFPCGQPSNCFELTGGGSTGGHDINGLYTFDGVNWNGFSGAVIMDGGDGYWYIHDALGGVPYRTTYANFPCTWEIFNPVTGVPPPPTGHYVIDPIPDGSGGFWELVVDINGNLGAAQVAPGIPTTYILNDGVGGFWRVIVDPAGNRGTQSDPGPGTFIPILEDANHSLWAVVVDAGGNLGTISFP